MKIDLAVLDRQFKLYQEEYEEAALRVLQSGWYILGTEGESFEKAFARYVGRKYCVGVNSGLDALTLSIRALGIKAGDEVLVPANTYIASVLAITENQATPIFVEPDEFYDIDASRLEAAITPRTKAVMVVHLYGQPARMDIIMSLANKYRLRVIEDCAQSHGAHYNGQMTGSFGFAGCFSFYPTKNLGAFGDAGAIVTNDENYYQKLCELRNYGSKVKYHHQICGVNSRLDEIQAALLKIKLEHLKELIDERKKIASHYLQCIQNPNIFMPKSYSLSEHVWHQFVVRTAERDAFQSYLQANGIETMIHYPIPPHLSECYTSLGHKKGDFPVTERYAEEILSLPIFNGMTQDEICYVVEICNQYKK